MSKKKKWWQTGSWSGNEQENLFPNSIAKHTQKLSERQEIELLKEEGFEDDYADYGYSSHNWGWDSKLSTKTYSEDKHERADINKSEATNYYSQYEKTGVWGGYKSIPQLSYKYIQQMANFLAVQHNVTVEIGKDWEVNLLSKKLIYNPTSLIYGTKSELLATLMHEIGKIRHVTHSSKLMNKYLDMYKNPAMEVLSIYEDVRTDYLMLKSYEGAAEIYESVIPTIETQVKNYMKAGKKFKEVIYNVSVRLVQSIEESNGNDTDRTSAAIQTFGIPNMGDLQKRLAVLKQGLDSTGTVYEYCGEMLSLMYDLDEQKFQKFPNITEKVKLTVHTIEQSKKISSSQELVNYLDSTTYPVVEDLLKDMSEKNDALQKAFPEMSESMKKQIMDYAAGNLYMSGMGHPMDNGVAVDRNGNTKTRTSGQTDSTVPPEWQNGEYRPLKDSVSTEIKQLINRLTFLKRNEMTVKWEANQKRGKLNSKKLYKIATGSRRLFKTKLDNVDTIQSFAFSVLVDTSGSMSGSRMVHTTRGLIILAEVFKKMNIPIEIIAFSDGATTIKGFDQELDKKMQKVIGGMAKCDGGGTNMSDGLDKLKIHNRPEKNKVVVVLTDGGVGDMKYFDRQYFIPWEKKGIKSVGFGLECEEEMAKLCQGNSKVMTDASKLPNEFSKLLKDVIKR